MFENMKPTRRHGRPDTRIPKSELKRPKIVIDYDAAEHENREAGGWNDEPDESKVPNYPADHPGHQRLLTAIFNDDPDDTPPPSGEGWTVEDERIADENEQARYDDHF